MVCHHVGTKYKIPKKSKSKNIWKVHGARRVMETGWEGVLRNTGRDAAKNSVQEELTGEFQEVNGEQGHVLQGSTKDKD